MSVYYNVSNGMNLESNCYKLTNAHPENALEDRLYPLSKSDPVISIIKIKT